jgi:translocation and assembly module TamB
MAIVFFAAALAGVILHLDRPVSRRFVVARVNAALAASFQGRIAIERVEHVSLGGIQGARVVIQAPDGTRVLVAEGVSAKADVLAIARSALFGRSGEPLAIAVHDVVVDHADVALDAGADGAMQLAAAFEPRERAPKAADEGPGRAVKLDLRGVAIRHAWVHGAPSKGAPAIDADVTGVSGSVAVASGAGAGPTSVSIDVPHVGLVARGLPRGASAKGDAKGHVELPSRAGSAFAVTAEYDGAVAGVAARARATLDGDRLDATVSAPHVTPALVRALAPESPLEEEASVRAEAHGALSNLDVVLDLTLAHDRGALHATATIARPAGGSSTRIGAAASVTGLDARAFTSDPGAPETVLGASAKGTFVVADGGAVTSDDLTASVLPGRVGDQRVPPATISARMATGASGAAPPAGVSIVGTAHVAEAGAPTDLTFELRPDGAIDVTARARIAALDRVPRLGPKPLATGTAQLQAKATIRPAKGTIDATVDADLVNVTVAGANANANADASASASAKPSGDRAAHATDALHLARGRLHVRATGPLASPYLDAELIAAGVDANGTRYPRARATARGPATSPHVEAWLGGARGAAAEVRAVADVDVATATLRNARATISRAGEHATLRAKTVRVSGGEVRVEDAVVEGFGAPARATVRVTRGQTVVKMRARHVAFSRVARLLHLERDVERGDVDVDVDLVVDRKGAHGHAVVDVTHASFAGWTDVDAHLKATFDGRRADATLHAALSDVGYADLATHDLVLGGDGAPLGLEALRKAFGRVDLDARVDLHALYALVPKGALPASDLAGILVVKGSATRDGQTDFTPELTLSARTEGLVVTRLDGERITGVDGEATTAVDGDTGAATARAKLVDSLGAFVTLDARSDAIPYAALVDGVDRAPHADGSPADRVALLERVPFTAKLVVPERAASALPMGLALEGTRGTVEGTVDFEGNVLHPKIEVTGGAHRLVSEGAAVTFPIDVDVTGSYDGSVARLEAQARTRRIALATAAAHAAIAVADLLDGERARRAGRRLPWTGAAQVRLSGFPLGRVPALSDRGIRGTVDGVLAMADLHTDAPRATAGFAITDLHVGALEYAGAKLVATASDRALEAALRVDQTDGLLEASAQAGVGWRDGFVPGLDPARPIDASLTAKNVRASGLLPAVDEIFTALDGRIDGAARAHLEAGAAAGGSSGANKGVVKLEGNLALTDGLVQVASTGTALHDVSAKLSLAPDGTVRLDDVSARGVSGKLTGSALAHLDALRVVDATAKLEIPKTDPIPFDVAGVNLGDLYGRFEARAKENPRTPSETDVDVDVRGFHVTLPVSASHAVRELGAPSNIHVGIQRRGEAFEVVSLGAPKAAADASAGANGAVPATVVAIHLLDDVVITRRGTLRVELRGDPTVKVTNDTQVTGQIDLVRGTLEVQNKKFEIEKGTVSFVGADPTNPTVVVSAGWTAPDGTRVYADFAGPLKTGKVNLRSEPPRPKSEILALIVFGNVEGSSSTPYANQGTSGGGTAGAAGAAAGGLAADGLARGVDQLTGIDVSAKIDASNPANPRPEVEVQIARSISLQLSYVLGTPPPGTNPDKTFATIDWRFLQRWSLQTTFGDQGSSFADVVWQYRY